MTFDSNNHHRRSLRLRGYDYTTPGAYFITICTYARRCALGTVTDGSVNLSRYGQIVTECWHAIPAHFPHVGTDAFVVMPNHVHGIIVIDEDHRRGTPWRAPTMRTDDIQGFHDANISKIERFGQPVAGSLPTIVRSLKSAATKQVNLLRASPAEPFWQRNYYEYVIRDSEALAYVRAYITSNPVRWHNDRFFAIN